MKLCQEWILRKLSRFVAAGGFGGAESHSLTSGMSVIIQEEPSSGRKNNDFEVKDENIWTVSDLCAPQLIPTFQSVVMKWGTVPVPAKLGKMDPSFFDRISDQIRSKKKSLHQSIKDFSTTSTRADTLTTVFKQLPDRQSLHELNEAPGKFRLLWQMK